MGEIKDKVHLSPAEAEIRAELGKKMSNQGVIWIQINRLKLSPSMHWKHILPLDGSTKFVRLPSARLWLELNSYIFSDSK